MARLVGVVHYGHACILGTLLTRSGVVSSVHAFAQSSIGNYFVGFLLLVFAVCLVAYVKNRDYLKSREPTRFDGFRANRDSCLTI